MINGLLKENIKHVICKKNSNLFYKEGKIYDVDRFFIGNVGDSKGKEFIVISLDSSVGLICQLELEKVLSGETDFLILLEEV